ncbi:hypothetical protein ACS0TY_026901 [Phlomoides rotata]
MANNISVNLAMEWLMMEGSTVDIGGGIMHVWGVIRASILAPMVLVCLCVCLVMSAMLLLEWVYMGAVLIYVKLIGKRSHERYKWEAMEEDEESGFPMVLVQIPLYNEREVYKLCIDAVCKLTWPVDRLIIQVLDDSSDTLIKDMIEKECVRWGEEGVNIRYQSRETRRGFKAGALEEGMECEYAKHCEHVAVFDSDFQPQPDFLLRAIPYLIHNPQIALVQARHTFVNADECLLTRLQEMNINYHFMAEQEVGSTVYSFFGFNGTAGIWRIAAINEAGGWKDRTTVEDMDLSVRVGLKGWKFVYVGTIEVKSELPGAFKAFRSQQYRWFSGPTDLFRQTAIDIVKNKEVSFWKKLHMIYSFFLVRKTTGHTCIFLYFHVVLPLAVLIPELDIKIGAAVFSSCIFTAINALFTTPRSLHLVVMYVFFECGMSFHRTKAIITGLLGTKSAGEWLVTAKLGDSINKKPHNKLTSPCHSRFKLHTDRILVAELGFAAFLFICGYYDFIHRKDYYYCIYLFLQAITLTLMGFGFIGRILPDC